MTLWIVMGTAFIGMLVCAKKQNDSTAAKPLLFIFTLVLLVSGAFFLKHLATPVSEDEILREQLLFAKSAGYKLKLSCTGKIRSTGYCSNRLQKKR